nr:protein phosphatase 2C domain-containing protein [Sphingomicrobium nitratireducens]
MRRKLNEDSYLERSEAGLFVVADGMGGHEAGEVASRMIVERLGSIEADSGLSARVDRAVAALGDVNADLIDLAHQKEGKHTIGSTVVGLAFGQGAFECFWAGDSRAYRLHDRKLTQISRDHSLVNDLVSAGMLKPEEAEHHPDANVITRAVGAAETLKVERVMGEAHQGDLFLLASDGLTRVVPDAELEEDLIRKNPMQAADGFIEKVLDRGAPDNVTLIIVRVG